MKILLVICVATLFTAGISADPDDNTPPTATTTTVLPDKSTTTEPPITTTETTAPTTESPTTVAAPNTSTADPITTKEPATTHAPVTTTKVPGPAECPFNITQGGVTCIRADLKISFTVPLEDKKREINLGCEAISAESDCSSNETQILNLHEASYNLTMYFEKESAKFYVRNITFEYTLPEGKGFVYNDTDKIFSVKTGNSYLCKSEATVHLGNVTMQISEIHVQAFLEKDNKNFGSAEECEADDKVSDIVPIAVGVALAALIIIVLIAYLVGRRRSRQKGYQSV